jgi:peptidoglycan/xylan/chitin deacetylase (PgdA/CDA1 family)
VKPAKYGPFPYSSIEQRPPLAWPDGAYLALWVIPNYEFFALDERWPPRGGMDPPDIVTWSMRDYGNRAGAYRMMRLLDRYDIRATVALNGDLCLQHPHLIAEGQTRGWEWMGHGESNSRTLRSIPPQDERRAIHDALATIETATGVRPAGWLGPALQESWDTLDHLAAEGVEYVSDWVNDDQPYRMQLEGGRQMIAMPYSAQLNDKIYETSHVTSGEFGAMIKRQFDVLYREGSESGRVMAIAYHPYISGVPHRIAAFDDALAHIRKHHHVWRATGSEIARHFAGVSP